MDLTGEYRVPASPQQVWDAITDPDVLQECIPGCESLTQTAENQFEAKVTSKIGAVKARFTGKVTLENLDPPRGYTLSGQGSGGAAGFAKGSAHVMLEPDGDGTLLRYEAKADVGGKLATVGGRLIQGVAKKNADDFFGALAARLGGGAAEPEAAETETGAVAGAPAAAESEKKGPLSGPWIWVGAAVAALIILGLVFG